jgi:FeS assembly SUF system protein
MDIDLVKEQIVEQIKTCYDPEIPVNIYEMGLIYDIDVQPDGRTEVKMTLTSPNCPAAQSIPAEVEEKVKSVDGVTDADIEIVWEPTWTIEMMSEDAKLELGIDY